MTWHYRGKPIEEIDFKKYPAFIYRIEGDSVVKGKQYIGKKFTGERYKSKGKWKWRNSNWKSYWGSGSLLEKDIEKHGKEHFKRIIIRFATTRGNANYLELKYQMDARVLEHPERYYNRFLGTRINARAIKLEEL